MPPWVRFAAGNLWLVTALVLFLGRKAVRYAPTRYAFFGVGSWLSPVAYGFLIVACIVIGLGLMRTIKASSPG
jgi:hypothetical protein